MGSAITREGDISTGHSTYKPSSATESSPDVFVNGIGVVRQGDAYENHPGPDAPSPPHTRTVAAGSGTVYANGKAITRIGDPIDCGDSSAQGSSDVFAG